MAGDARRARTDPSAMRQGAEFRGVRHGATEMARPHLLYRTQPAPCTDCDQTAAIAAIGDGKPTAMDMTMKVNAMLVPANSAPSALSHDNLPTGIQTVARGQAATVIAGSWPRGVDPKRRADMRLCMKSRPEIT